MTRPLPRLSPKTGWEDVPIDAIAEPLVRVGQLHARVLQEAAYHLMGFPGALSECWVRQGVAERLVQVADSLPAGLSLLVWDGYRPFPVQRALFERYVDELIAVHPELPADAIEDAATRYVSRPSRAKDAPSPHLTGGAVDLTLCTPEGVPLDLGTGFDAFVPAAGATAFENQPGEVRDNRRRLFWSMAGAGFTAYTEEWWHFDYGDQFWGHIRGETACYGPMPSPE